MHATAISNSPNQCIVLEKQEIFKINITQYKHGAAKRFRLWQNSNEKSVVFNKEKRLCLRINTKTNHSTTFAFSFQMHRIHHKSEKGTKKNVQNHLLTDEIYERIVEVVEFRIIVNGVHDVCESCPFAVFNRLHWRVWRWYTTIVWIVHKFQIDSARFCFLYSGSNSIAS